MNLNLCYCPNWIDPYTNMLLFENPNPNENKWTSLKINDEVNNISMQRTRLSFLLHTELCLKWFYWHLKPQCIFRSAFCIIANYGNVYEERGRERFNGKRLLSIVYSAHLRQDEFTIMTYWSTNIHIRLKENFALLAHYFT